MFKQLLGVIEDYIDTLPDCKYDITSDELSESLDFLKNNAYTQKQSITIYVFGKMLCKIGNYIQDSITPQVEDYLVEEEEAVKFGNNSIYLRNYYDDIYPSDEQLKKYEDLYEKKKAEAKELKDSVKNRKDQLKEEGKVIRDIKSKSIIVR